MTVYHPDNIMQAFVKLLDDAHEENEEVKYEVDATTYKINFNQFKFNQQHQSLETKMQLRIYKVEGAADPKAQDYVMEFIYKDGHKDKLYEHFTNLTNEFILKEGQDAGQQDGPQD